jgi:hypothetical protein
MSDVSQGPGWWQASDGKWYPPETHPDYVSGDAPTVAGPFAAPPGGPQTAGGPPAGQPFGGPPGSPPAGPPLGAPPPGQPFGGQSAGGPPPGGPPLPVAPANSGGGRRRGVLLGLVALVAVLLIGGGVFAATRGGGSDVAADGRSDSSDQSKAKTKPKATNTDTATDATKAPSGSEATGSASSKGPASDSASTQGDVQIVDEGGSQFTDDSGKPNGSWAAILINKGTKPAELIEIDVSLLNSAGTVLGTKTTFVSVLAPGAQTAVIGDMFDVPAGVSKLQLRVAASDFPSGKAVPKGDLTAAGVNTNPGDFGGLKVTGTLNSTFAQDLKDVETVAVFFDKSNTIIGGAETFVNLVPARSNSGFEIDDFNQVPDVDHVKVFTQLPSSVQGK